MSDKKTVFITGGSTGIGAAAVRKFHACGWDVAFMDINDEAAAQTVKELPDVLYVHGNVRCKDEIAAAVGKRLSTSADLIRSSPMPAFIAAIRCLTSPTKNSI